MNLPKEYIDETYGVRPAPNQPSFNNIIYLAWYIIARKILGKLSQYDLDAMNKHLELNNDKYNLYKPKNSHDNITYKMILLVLFGDINKANMSFSEALKETFFRPWDFITYGSVFGPKLLRPFFWLFLWIPVLQMIHACWTEGKVRPKWFGDGELSRWRWWLKAELVKIEETDIITYKHWKLPNGEIRISRHMQNDGKHLAIFRLYALKNNLPPFKICARICRHILMKRYGKDYASKIVENYFIDRNHPLIFMWSKIDGDILKED